MRAAPTILVVDDDTTWRELVALRLRGQGAVTAVAGSVSDAIDELERLHVDLVLTDHRMPGASGIDLLAYVHTRHPEIPVIVMSAVVDDELVDAAFGGGAVGVHEKSKLTALPQEAVLAWAA